MCSQGIMEIISIGPAVVIVPLFQHWTKAEIVACQYMRWLSNSAKEWQGSAEIILSSEPFLLGQAGFFFCGGMSQADMMESEQFTQTRRGEPILFQSHYKHLLILPVPEVIHENKKRNNNNNKNKCAGKTVENKVKQDLSSWRVSNSEEPHISHWKNILGLPNHVATLGCKSFDHYYFINWQYASLTFEKSGWRLHWNLSN